MSSLANPNGFDYFSIGEPLPFLNASRSASSGLDYFSIGEPLQVLLGSGPSVTVSGTVQVGQILTAVVVGYNVLSYSWERADDASGTNHAPTGGVGSTYTVSSADVNKYLRVGIVHD